MKIHKLKNFTKGWVVGDFEPSIIQTKDFEFMVRYYTKGENETKHVHKIADEITAIVSGRFTMNGQEVSMGDVVQLKPGEPTDFHCLEDGAIAVIKTPSITGDKYII